MLIEMFNGTHMLYECFLIDTPVSGGALLPCLNLRLKFRHHTLLQKSPLFPQENYINIYTYTFIYLLYYYLPTFNSTHEI